MARLRRFGLIGDVHAEHESLEAALAALEGVDAVLCVGDIVDGVGDAERCCELLRDSGALVVRGNHDRWLLRSQMRKLPDATDAASLSSESLAWLSTLPATRTIPTLDGPLLLCHAVGDDDMTRLADDDHGYALESNEALARVIASGARMMICGHTHRAYVRRLGELSIINAGTLHRDGPPGFFEIDLELRVARRYAIGVGATVFEASRAALP